MVLTAQITSKYRRTEVTAVLAGLDPRVAQLLGLCDGITWDPITYQIVVRQAKRLENAFKEGGWTTAEGERRNMAWFKASLIKASLPEDIAEIVAAIAIDSTGVWAWAKSRRHIKEKDVRKAREAVAEGKLPEWAAAAGAPRADLGAAYGYSSATSTRAAGIFFGYDHHFAVASCRISWHGDPDEIVLGEPVAPYILAHSAVPALTPSAPKASRSTRSQKRSPRASTKATPTWHTPDRRSTSTSPCEKTAPI